MGQLLERINSPQDLHLLSVDELQELAEEIRHHITHSVSQTGGHLASNLGVVELSIAMHYVFEFKKDRLLWDVGHQCYAHKILTGRKDKFDGLRKRDGLSGFPCPDESEYDLFSVGHAGTSMATAAGMALGAQLNKTNEKIVALVGDASIVNGLSFEAMNNMGLVKRQMLVVLNDNSMAIDVTQGAIAKFLSRIRLTHTYEDLRKSTHNILEHLPLVGNRMEGAIKNFTKTLRMAVTPNRLFESMNIPYFGPVDGHDIGSLIKLFRAMSELNRPAILHVYTKKGKGFAPADDDPRKFHSTGPFVVNGKVEENVGANKRTFTQSFSDAVTDLAREDDRIVAITAAMPDGTGLGKFRKEFPDRYFDVGIAESSAVDIAAGLAKQGLRPVVCIYSTFLQRGFDQVFQEVSLQNLPVVFCIDRGGLVGNDGPTHHGLMDVGYMRMMPNFNVISPANEAEIRGALSYAIDSDGPVAIRYPKDVVSDDILPLPQCDAPFETGKSVTVRDGSSDIFIVALGSVLTEAVKSADILKDEGISVTVINGRFAKPVDEKIATLACEGKTIITVEDHNVACGFGSAVLEAVSSRGGKGKVLVLGGPDEFIRAGARSVQLGEIGVSSDKIVDVVRKQVVSG